VPNPATPDLANLAEQPAIDPKAILRRSLLAARQRLAEQPAQAARMNAQLGARLAQVLAQRQPQCVGFYWPVAGEFDARATLSAWLAQAPGRQAGLPVVTRPAAPLVFHAWQPDTEMQSGRYGIPIPRDGVTVEPDLLLVPCVGFDASRLRLGYGGGYYDRTLAALTPRPVTIGVAFECSRLAALPREPHDIPLDLIVTDSGCY